jgi:hypothetical protein
MALVVVVAQSAGVAEQHAQSDGLAWLSGGPDRVAEQVRHVRVEAEPPLLDQLQHADGDHQLADRGDPGRVVGGDAAAGHRIGQTFRIAAALASAVESNADLRAGIVRSAGHRCAGSEQQEQGNQKAHARTLADASLRKQAVAAARSGRGRLVSASPRPRRQPPSCALVPPIRYQMNAPEGLHLRVTDPHTRAHAGSADADGHSFPSLQRSGGEPSS